MTEFRYLRGAVYIFENKKAQRVKVGMTINRVLDRLLAVNEMWLERKVTCQICGGRRLATRNGFVPLHVVSGVACHGGGALPLEKDTVLAKAYLEAMKDRVGVLSGSEKRSAARMANNLEERMERYRQYAGPVGHWTLGVIFYTERAEQVELLSHEILDEHLDRSAPFGEVFNCSVPVATNAVETVLSQLGLLPQTRRSKPGS